MIAFVSESTGLVFFGFMSKAFKRFSHKIEGNIGL